MVAKIRNRSNQDMHRVGDRVLGTGGPPCNVTTSRRCQPRDPTGEHQNWAITRPSGVVPSPGRSRNQSRCSCGSLLPRRSRKHPDLPRPGPSKRSSRPSIPFGCDGATSNRTLALDPGRRTCGHGHRLGVLATRALTVTVGCLQPLAAFASVTVTWTPLEARGRERAHS